LKIDSPEGTSQISINGTGADQSQWQIDGINDTINDENKGYGRVAYIPPHGAVFEFKLQGNPYDASPGHMLGSVISVNTKAARTTCTARRIITSRTAPWTALTSSSTRRANTIRSRRITATG